MGSVEEFTTTVTVKKLFTLQVPMYTPPYASSLSSVAGVLDPFSSVPTIIANYGCNSTSVYGLPTAFDMSAVSLAASSYQTHSRGSGYASTLNMMQPIYDGTAFYSYLNAFQQTPYANIGQVLVWEAIWPFSSTGYIAKQISPNGIPPDRPVDGVGIYTTVASVLYGAKQLFRFGRLTVNGVPMDHAIGALVVTEFPVFPYVVTMDVWFCDVAARYSGIYQTNFAPNGSSLISATKGCYAQGNYNGASMLMSSEVSGITRPWVIALCGAALESDEFLSEYGNYLPNTGEWGNDLGYSDCAIVPFFDDPILDAAWVNLSSRGTVTQFGRGFCVHLYDSSGNVRDLLLDQFCRSYIEIQWVPQSATAESFLQNNVTSTGFSWGVDPVGVFYTHGGLGSNNVANSFGWDFQEYFQPLQFQWPTFTLPCFKCDPIAQGRS